MASFLMLLCAASLFITMLLWPPTSPAGPKSCAENMKDIYSRVSLRFIADGEKVQEFINDTLPAFKAACPTEAKSIKDLENGRYVLKLVAKRERDKKAYRHIKSSAGSTGGAGEDMDLEDLELQR
jgi:hypothetical protein